MKPPSLAVVFREPLWKSVTDPTGFSTKKPDAYSHAINAWGGYWSASAAFSSSWNNAQDWIENGLGRDIQVSGDGLNRIWEGFVNQIRIEAGPLSATIGPLLGIANRVRAIYATLDSSVAGQPVVGMRQITDDIDDAGSQANWPIIPYVLNVGTMSLAMANANCALHLQKFAFPKTNEQLSFPEGSAPRVTVECLGYVHLLNYPIFDAAAGDVIVSTKITTALGQTPNSAWLDYGTDHVDTSNTEEITAFENEDRLALNVIEEAVGLGDSSGNRWLFGVYDDQDAYYEQAPDDVEYISRIASPRVEVQTLAGDSIYPWNVRPGKWAKIVDYLPLKLGTSPLSSDPRLMFIEGVNYTMPWGLSLSEGGVDKADQFLAQMGIGAS